MTVRRINDSYAELVLSADFEVRAGEELIVTERFGFQIDDDRPLVGEVDWFMPESYRIDEPIAWMVQDISIDHRNQLDKAVGGDQLAIGLGLARRDRLCFGHEIQMRTIAQKPGLRFRCAIMGTYRRKYPL